MVKLTYFKNKHAKEPPPPGIVQWTRQILTIVQGYWDILLMLIVVCCTISGICFIMTKTSYSFDVDLIQREENRINSIHKDLIQREENRINSIHKEPNNIIIGPLSRNKRSPLPAMEKKYRDKCSINDKTKYCKNMMEKIRNLQRELLESVGDKFEKILKSHFESEESNCTVTEKENLSPRSSDLQSDDLLSQPEINKKETLNFRTIDPDTSKNTEINTNVRNSNNQESILHEPKSHNASLMNSSIGIQISEKTIDRKTSNDFSNTKNNDVESPFNKGNFLNAPIINSSHESDKKLNNENLHIQENKFHNASVTNSTIDGQVLERTKNLETFNDTDKHIEKNTQSNNQRSIFDDDKNTLIGSTVIGRPNESVILNNTSEHITNETLTHSSIVSENKEKTNDAKTLNNTLEHIEKERQSNNDESLFNDVESFKAPVINSLIDSNITGRSNDLVISQNTHKQIKIETITNSPNISISKDRTNDPDILNNTLRHNEKETQSNNDESLFNDVDFFKTPDINSLDDSNVIGETSNNEDLKPRKDIFFNRTVTNSTSVIESIEGINDQEMFNSTSKNHGNETNSNNEESHSHEAKLYNESIPNPPNSSQNPEKNSKLEISNNALEFKTSERKSNDSAPHFHEASLHDPSVTNSSVGTKGIARSNSYEISENDVENTGKENKSDVEELHSHKLESVSTVRKNEKITKNVEKEMGNKNNINETSSDLNFFKNKNHVSSNEIPHDVIKQKFTESVYEHTNVNNMSHFSHLNNSASKITDKQTFENSLVGSKNNITKTLHTHNTENNKQIDKHPFSTSSPLEEDTNRHQDASNINILEKEDTIMSPPQSAALVQENSTLLESESRKPVNKSKSENIPDHEISESRSSNRNVLDQTTLTPLFFVTEFNSKKYFHIDYNFTEAPDDHTFSDFDSSALLLTSKDEDHRDNTADAKNKAKDTSQRKAENSFQSKEESHFHLNGSNPVISKKSGNLTKLEQDVDLGKTTSSSNLKNMPLIAENPQFGNNFNFDMNPATPHSISSQNRNSGPATFQFQPGESPFFPTEETNLAGAITSEKMKVGLQVVQPPRPPIGFPMYWFNTQNQPSLPRPTQSGYGVYQVYNVPFIPPSSLPYQYGPSIGNQMQSAVTPVPTYSLSGNKPSFMVPPGSQMPPQAHPYICTYLSHNHASGSQPGTSDFRAAGEMDMETSQARNFEEDFEEDRHLSEHYKDIENMANKIYGNHTLVEVREAKCLPGKRGCASGKCIYASMWCDGVVHCIDASDETHCSCKSRIDKSRICDGFYDCPLGEDELGCLNCGLHSFSCNEATRNHEQPSCFSIDQRCDGQYDCPNKIDEHECTLLHNDLKHHATYSISHSKGFLHKNFKGKWYPVCKNPYTWAKDACAMETRDILGAPYIQHLEQPQTFKGVFIQQSENGKIEFSRDCFSGSAVFVTCPNPKCGTSADVVSQTLRRLDFDDDLYSRRRKRTHETTIKKQVQTRQKRHIHYDPIISLGPNEEYQNQYQPFAAYHEIYNGQVAHYDSHFPTLEYPEENYGFADNNINVYYEGGEDNDWVDPDAVVNFNSAENSYRGHDNYMEFPPYGFDSFNPVPSNLINYLDSPIHDPTVMVNPVHKDEENVIEKYIKPMLDSDNAHDIHKKINEAKDETNIIAVDSKDEKKSNSRNEDQIGESDEKKSISNKPKHVEETENSKTNETKGVVSMRVVGGQMCEPAEWPWVVALYKNGVFTCGGVLISDSWVLSAAHCFDRYWRNYYEIRAGLLRRSSYSPQEQAVPVTRIMVHQEYNKTSMQNDVSLIRLRHPLSLNRWVRPVCLPSESTAGHSWQWGPTPGTTCTAVGWGATIEKGPDPDHLRKVQIPILSHCKAKEDRLGMEICAGLPEGGKDACQGDSGGPFMCRNPHNPKQYYVAGIVSHGEGCARPDQPGVYTRVSIFLDWIRDHMADDHFPSLRPKQRCPGFNCVWGIKKCLPRKKRCDRIVDCLGAEDEVDCPNLFEDDKERRSPKSSSEESQESNEVLNRTIETTTHFSSFSTIIDLKKFDELANGIKINFTPKPLNATTSVNTHTTVTTNKPLSISSTTFENSENANQVTSTSEAVDIFLETGKHLKSDNINISTNPDTEIVSTLVTSEIIDYLIDKISEASAEESNHTLYNISEGNTEAHKVKTEEDKKWETITKENVSKNTITENSVPLRGDQVLENDKNMSSNQQIPQSARNVVSSPDRIFRNTTKNEFLEIKNMELVKNKSFSRDNSNLVNKTSMNETNQQDGKNNNFPSFNNTSNNTQMANKSIIAHRNDFQVLSNNASFISNDSLQTSANESLDVSTLKNMEESTIFNEDVNFSSKGLMDKENANELPTTTMKESIREEKQLHEFIDVINADEAKEKQINLKNMGSDINQPTTPLFEVIQTDTPFDLLPNKPLITGPIKPTQFVKNKFDFFTVKPGSSEIGDIKTTTSKTIFEANAQHSHVEKKNLVNIFKKGRGLKDQSPFDIVKTLNSFKGEVVPIHPIPRPEPPPGFKCKILNQTISYWERCDRHINCEDGSDEWNCSCAEHLYYSQPTLICDGYVDCSDGTDESKCTSCPEGYMQCVISKSCVPNNQVCNGERDCVFGEDELDCFTLYNGDRVVMDLDSRPHLNFEGVISVRNDGVWKPLCKLQWTNQKQEETAKSICNYLGFSDAEFSDTVELRQSVTYEFVPASNQQSQSRVKSATVPKGSNESTRNNPLQRAVSEIFMPPLPEKNCLGLFIRCFRGIITNTTFHKMPGSSSNAIDSQYSELSDEIQDMYLWPWVGKVYTNGIYTCSGVLVDFSWLLVQDACASVLSLHDNYVSVVLGSKRSIPIVDGPYEQTIRVDGTKHVVFSSISLLHLENPALFSRYVKPIHMPSFNMTDIHEDSICLISAINDMGHAVSIFLEPLQRECGLTKRCFNSLHNPTNCELPPSDNPLVKAAWSGIVVCHRSRGWYPAAFFVEPRGECGLKGVLSLEDLAYRRPDIISIIANQLPDTVLAAHCPGVRCHLGHCIHPMKVCDGVPDCRNGEDETSQHCEIKRSICQRNPFLAECAACATSQIRCLNGRCIPKELFANGFDDCGDGSDEPINPSCSHYLTLSSPHKICDGVTHCKDKSDEYPFYCKCHAKPSYPCKHTDMCIPFDSVCDGRFDCPNKDDEMSCTALNSQNPNRVGVGEVVVQKHGIWHTKCFEKSNFTKLELEAICRQLGYSNGHALRINDSNLILNNPITEVITDSFTDVTFKNVVISMRNSIYPLGIERILSKDKICHRLHVECVV